MSAPDSAGTRRTRTDLAVQAFEFTDAHFETLRELVTSVTGVQLPDVKRQLAYTRFAKRLRQLGLRSFDEYLARLRDPHSDELGRIPSIITTNVTSFMREPHHFRYLREVVLPRLSRAPRIRIWSSACSTGEEPYSIASVVLDVFGGPTGRVTRDIRILATDIDDQALMVGAMGAYSRHKVPEEFAERWMTAASGEHLRVRPELRRLITFKALNLLDPWPMRGPFDVIFCRNVVIYFDAPTKAALFARQAELQRPGDTLMIGHSEQLCGPAEQYRRVGHTIYEKIV